MGKSRQVMPNQSIIVSANQKLGIAWPMTAIVAWLAVADTDYYKVEEDVSGWVIRKKVAGYKAADLKQASPVLTKAINDPDRTVRSTGVNIVTCTGYYTEKTSLQFIAHK